VLHTLELFGCVQLTHISALAVCAMLHTLDLQDTEVADVSALAGCAKLHTLGLRQTEVADVSPLAGCAALHALDLSYCEGLTDVSALAEIPALRTLDLSGCDGLTDVLAARHCTPLSWCAAAMLGTCRRWPAAGSCTRSPSATPF